MEQLVFHKNGELYEAEFTSGSTTTLHIQFEDTKASTMNVFCRADEEFDWYEFNIAQIPRRKWFANLFVPSGIQMKVQATAPVYKAVVIKTSFSSDSSELSAEIEELKTSVKQSSEFIDSLSADIDENGCLIINSNK